MRRTRWLSTIGLLLALLMLAGCTRKYYRRFADRDVYRIEKERQFDWRWDLPKRPVEANPIARIGDKNDPDHVPIPPDDAGARPFQVTAGRPFEFVGWKGRGTTPIEDLAWLSCIPRQSDGSILLNPQSAMQVALMNSRDYQTQVENVYLQALTLTLQRFQFFPQLTSTQTTQYRHLGATNNESNQLQLFTQNALNWTFYSGANLLVNFANQLVFEYNGKGFQTVNTPLVISLSQPLLQGAWARNFTQPLSAVERTTLYVVRAFASYRRSFYVNVVTNYLNLLVQLQQLRNQENNVRQFRENLEEYDALVKAGILNPVERDNTATGYLQAKIQYLSLQANFQTTLDQYRVATLGLPADFPMKVDDTLLNQFELNDKRVDDLREANEALFLSLLQFDEPPPKKVMADAARKLKAEFLQLQAVSELVGQEMARWKERIEAERGKMGSGPGPIEEDDRESFAQQVKLSEDLSKGFRVARAALADNIDNTDEFLETLDSVPAADAFRKIRQDLIGRDFRARLSEVFLIQGQVRVYLIDLKRVELTVKQAIEIALANRLDLMNSLGQVTDAWRFVEYGGNQLLAGLNVFYTANLNTAPGQLGILRFDAHESQQLAGFQFTPPIVRRQQRNAYRGYQIAYQRARRQYMLNHDQIVQGIRLDMRNLNLNRRQFEIGRQALLVAVRLLDQTEYNVRTGAVATQGSTSLFLQQALNSLLSAKNNLINDWVQYEQQRLGLYRDFDLMNIDAQGVWTNDGNVPTFNGGPAPSTPDPVGAPTEPLLPGPAPDANGNGPGPFAPPP